MYITIRIRTPDINFPYNKIEYTVFGGVMDIEILELLKLEETVTGERYTLPIKHLVKKNDRKETLYWI